MNKKIKIRNGCAFLTNSTDRDSGLTTLRVARAMISASPNLLKKLNNHHQQLFSKFRNSEPHAGKVLGAIASIVPFRGSQESMEGVVAPLLVMSTSWLDIVSGNKYTRSLTVRDEMIVFETIKTSVL